MRIPVWLATIICGAMLAAQGWLVQAVIDLKTDMAAIKATVAAQTENHAHKKP